MEFYRVNRIYRHFSAIQVGLTIRDCSEPKSEFQKFRTLSKSLNLRLLSNVKPIVRSLAVGSTEWASRTGRALQWDRRFPVFTLQVA